MGRPSQVVPCVRATPHLRMRSQLSHRSSPLSRQGRLRGRWQALERGYLVRTELGAALGCRQLKIKVCACALLIELAAFRFFYQRDLMALLPCFLVHIAAASPARCRHSATSTLSVCRLPTPHGPRVYRPAKVCVKYGPRPHPCAKASRSRSLPSQPHRFTSPGGRYAGFGHTSEKPKARDKSEEVLESLSAGWSAFALGETPALFTSPILVHRVM